MPDREGHGGHPGHTTGLRLVPQLAKALNVPTPAVRRPGSAWTELPRPARPTTSTGTSSSPPASSTAWRRRWADSASSTTPSPSTCANPSTTSTACGPLPSAPPTSPTRAATSRTNAAIRAQPTATTSNRRLNEHHHRSRTPHRRGPGRPPPQDRSRPCVRPPGHRPAPPRDSPGQCRRRRPPGVRLTHLPLRRRRGQNRGHHSDAAVGQLRDLPAEWTEDVIQRITTENTTHEQRVRQLNTDNRTLDERLKAARSNLHFQDRRIADLEGRLTEN